jgi:hypothetical protein
MKVKIQRTGIMIFIKFNLFINRSITSNSTTVRLYVPECNSVASGVFHILEYIM